MRVNISGAKNWHLCSLRLLLRTGRDEMCRTESDTGIPLVREGVWEENPQHCCNLSTNYPWCCSNYQQHPFNYGLRKQAGFICINTVYIWYTMDWPANGLLITYMHILTLAIICTAEFCPQACVSHITNWFLLASWRGHFKFHSCSIDCMEESSYKFFSVPLHKCRCSSYECFKSVSSQTRALWPKH
jgi:hypothetical protein